MVSFIEQFHSITSKLYKEQGPKVSFIERFNHITKGIFQGPNCIEKFYCIIDKELFQGCVCY